MLCWTLAISNLFYDVAVKESYWCLVTNNPITYEAEYDFTAQEMHLQKELGEQWHVSTIIELLAVQLFHLFERGACVGKVAYAYCADSVGEKRAILQIWQSAIHILNSEMAPTGAPIYRTHQIGSVASQRFTS